MSRSTPSEGDPFHSEAAAFYDYLASHGLRRTQQRETILRTFLSEGRHLNLDELTEKVRQSDPTVGYTTVYRTVTIFIECGIARELRLTDDIRRFEPVRPDRHHDHLICLECGQTIEFFNCTLEMHQIIAAGKLGFKPVRHSLKIYGICRECQAKSRPLEAEPPAGS